ncbi:LysR family transcriptional regulator [Candidatus Deianiraea vastatrix]|uniref:HTH-type transcriptional regulator n=1 Tax=Candidatus Deianiraea vastatrix TaxID=2163644 RepID=A0A5B8XI33_9RICK|nr:LysR family transcriptional regulator [Candidatus Deianiraea vastatrix]QED23407.1 Putative HTH-type transcriptional regulator [Candidatus Deianiraea vastatrix]
MQVENSLKGFCATVECGNSVNDAATRNCISATTISKQISSLETDLGFLLFDRVKNKLVLNEKGRVYYKEVKRVLLDLDRLYAGKLGIKRVSSFSIFRKNLQNKIKYNLSLVNLKLKIMLIRITLKGFLVFLLVCITAIWVYLYRTNWFFDRKIYKLAKPLLRSVMESGHYRIPEIHRCQPQTVIISSDLIDVLLTLIKEKHLLKITRVGHSECPSTQLRMTGDDAIDKPLFFHQKNLNCDIDRYYLEYNKSYHFIQDLLKNDSEFKFYTLYHNSKCLNHNILNDNIKKYPNQIFNINHSDEKIARGSFWIVKNGNYYYLVSETNGMQAHGANVAKDSYIIFQKLTLNDLKHYDNGSYWKLIKEYNINID